MADGAGDATRSWSCILPDGGRNYLSKLYNDEWMRANGLLATPGSFVRILRSSSTTTTTARAARCRRGPDHGAASARRSRRSRRYGISQMPV